LFRESCPGRHERRGFGVPAVNLWGVGAGGAFYVCEIDKSVKIFTFGLGLWKWLAESWLYFRWSKSPGLS
jgi:hypothetical protein